MANKDFSILAKLSLNAAGFTSGKDRVSKDAKALERGVTASNNAIKQSFSSLTNAALPDFANQFGGLGSVFGSIKTAIGGLIPAFKSVKTALISTGIGAIIIAITTAIAGLIGWMKRTDEGGDTMRHVFDVIKAVIEVVLTKITALGSAIVKVFKGDFKGAMEDAKTAVTGWGVAMKEAINTANELNRLHDELEDYDETFALNRAKIEERISELQYKVRDEETYNARQRLAFNKELEKAKKDLYNLDFRQKQLQLDIAKQEYEIGAKNQDERQKVNEKEAELIKLRTTYNQGLKETIKLNNKLVDDAKKEGLADTKLNNKAPEKVNITGLNISTLAPKNIDNDIIKLTQYKVTIDEITNSILKLNDDITNNLVVAVEKLSNSFIEGGETFKEYANNIKNAVRQTIGAFIAEGVAAMVLNAIKSAVKTPYGFLIAPALASLAGGLAKTAFNSLIPSFAAGGIMPHTGMALVGERGAELVKLPAGSQIYNNFQTRNIMSGNGRVEFELKGNKLVGVLNNYYRGVH